MTSKYRYTDISSIGTAIAPIRKLVNMNESRVSGLALAKNLQLLMEHNKLTQAQLAKRSGVAQSTLSNLLDLSKPLEINPRARTVDQLADVFGIPGWQLFVPDLPIELLASPRLMALVSNYLAASPGGRETIDRIASAEVRYSEFERPRTSAASSR
ncbi:helix-turn-helix transcriptional regulator [Stenotrophomonas lactitubi]|uniref:helix-turn-helix transcriptional regulator n=1 Tax=Stenotrophomonas lactitubi TaxID=2045214 RepID=UPI0032086DF6